MLPTFKEIELDKLVLDTHNPRLPASMHGKDDKEIISYMLTDASLIELMLAIGQNNFFPGEQLLVVPIEGNKFKVVEGNRRLSALKLLSNPELVDVQRTKIEKVIAETTFRPQNIPCLEFEKEEDIHNYLGYRHITGIKEWKLLEKSRYLTEYKKNNYKDLTIASASREIAKVIGSRKDYVERILIGYEVYTKIADNDFYKIRDLDDTTFYFNYIADSLNRSNIVEFLGIVTNSENPTKDINEQNLKKWTQWLFEKNDQNKTRLIGDSYDLTSLNAILGNPVALEAFDVKGVSLEEARELTDIIDNQFVIYLQKALKNLESADRLVARVNESTVDVEEEIKNIRLTAQKILRTLQEKNEDL